jgi:hypothetical protein
MEFRRFGRKTGIEERLKKDPFVKNVKTGKAVR